MKIVAEDKAVESRTNDFMNDWERSKPVEGHLRPDEALQHLQMYESKFARLKEERDNVAKAKEALELQEPGKLLHILAVDVNQHQTDFGHIKYVTVCSGV
jgi:dynein heavy chain 1